MRPYHHRHRILFLFLIALLLLHPFASSLSLAETEAKDIVNKCILRVSCNREQRQYLTTRSLHQWWDGDVDGVLTVTLPKGKKAQGVMLAFYEAVPELIIEGLDGDTPAEIARYQQPYHNQFIPFEKAVNAFQIRCVGEIPLKISRVNVLTEGLLPAWVQSWQPPEENAELLLIATHPDDEVLWFGGLLPLYAGELQRRVAIAFVHTCARLDSRNELLDALWHCGVRSYPYIPDQPYTSDYLGYVTSCVRKAKPQVVVTQDINGEYGHLAHRLTVAAVISAVAEGGAADPAMYPESAAAFGLWQPQKLYIHLWPENQSTFDWMQRLPALGNKSAYRIAVEAFKKHMSQQSGRHEFSLSGLYDCRKLGLYFSLVGPDDTAHPDLLQHIEPLE